MGEAMLHDLCTQALELAATLDTLALQQQQQQGAASTPPLAGGGEGDTPVGAEADDDELDDELAEGFESLALNEDTDNEGGEAEVEAEAGAEAGGGEEIPAATAARPHAPPSLYVAPGRAWPSRGPCIDLQAESARLLEWQRGLRAGSSAAQRAMAAQRAALPAAGLRDEVLAAVRNHLVTVISGATGCKSHRGVVGWLVSWLVG